MTKVMRRFGKNAATRDEWEFAIYTHETWESGKMHANYAHPDKMWDRWQAGSLPDYWTKYLTGTEYVIWSYKTPIAWYVPNHGHAKGAQQAIWYMPHIRYSNTTTQHQYTVRRAILDIVAKSEGNMILIQNQDGSPGPGHFRAGKGKSPFGPRSGW